MSEQAAPATTATNAPTTIMAPEPPSVMAMYRAVVGVGLLCGLLIVLVFEGTKPIIEANRAEALQAAIFRVVPDAAQSASFAWTPDAGFAPLAKGAKADDVVHAAYDDAGGLVGVAFEGAGMGYQDTVRVLFGYAPDADVIVGMEILESRETPGLGDKVETDATYLKNFAALDVTLAGDGASLVHPIEVVKPGKKTSPWQVDTISGATITSTAVADIAGDAARRWVPRVEAGLEGLRR